MRPARTAGDCQRQLIAIVQQHQPVFSSSGGDGVDDGEHTMVKVLCSQRDRFKEKAHQLEVQLAEARPLYSLLSAAALLIALLQPCLC